MLIPILIVIVVVVAVLAVVIAMRPNTFTVQRQATMAAPPAKVFALVNDFHEWMAWSPWENRDPAQKRTYDGPTSDVGAKYAWAGNRNVGEGRMTIMESRPGELIRIKLEFLKPFAATNDTVYTFTPQGNQTLVTWTMSGKNTFITKAMQMMMSMDKMVGGDFEKGLASMKAVSEAAAK